MMPLKKLLWLTLSLLLFLSIPLVMSPITVPTSTYFSVNGVWKHFSEEHTFSTVERINGIWYFDGKTFDEVEGEVSSSGKYLLVVNVRCNNLPAEGIVEINGVNRTTLLSLCVWELPYGTYEVHAFFGSQKQSMTVLLNENKTVGFNFIVLPKPPNFTPLIMVLVVILVALMLFLLFSRKH
jgi:hypothetical protein